jgi:SAM-dependent methyltransferase
MAIDDFATGALERWHDLVEARRVQMEAQLAAIGGPPEDWWSGRAASFARDVGDPLGVVPFGLAAIRDRLGRADSLIDIGGGAGRYSLPLARTLAHVTIVEPSPAMAAFAEAGRVELGLDNVRVLEREWPPARHWRDLEVASAVLIANVLGPDPDLARWIDSATRHARDWLFIEQGTVGEFGVTREVIEAVHGEPRVRSPNVADLLPALHELGVYPDVRMGTRRFARSYADLDDATRALAEAALTPRDDTMLTKVRRIARRRLRRGDDGRLHEPGVDRPLGLLVWRL